MTTEVQNRTNIRAHLDRALAKPARRHSEQSIDACRTLLKEKNATLIAHYYVADSLQKLAEESGGFVGDSLQMAQFGADCKSSMLIVAGVRFMGETAKILSPQKKVLMPDLHAECSLDLSCPANELAQYCEQFPDHVKVVYANTSAQVKALSDWVVTSSIAVALIEHLAEQGKNIIWAPDKHLGNYLNKQTGANMRLWDGACVVHEEFKAQLLRDAKNLFPAAAVLAHPESPESVLQLADAIGSTSQLINYAKTLSYNQYIVATDKGILYKMQQQVPDKELIIAPTAGQGATCRSCAHCPWMALNELDNLAEVLEKEHNEILLDDDVIRRAAIPLQRMMEFGKQISV